MGNEFWETKAQHPNVQFNSQACSLQQHWAAAQGPIKHWFSVDMTCKVILSALRTVHIALSAKLSLAILEVLLRNTITHWRYWKLNACKTQILHKTPDKRQHRESWYQLPHISGYLPAQIGEKQTLWQSSTAAFCKANLSPQESCYTRGPKVAQGPSLCSAPSHRGHLVSSFESRHSSTAH